MQKALLYIVLATMISATAYAQQKADAVIWNREGLTWNDFVEVENIGQGHLARIYWKFHIVPADSLIQKDSARGLRVKIYALMIPSLSKVKASGNRRGLLEHEQVHFDNVELAARKLRKEISETIFDSKNYRKELNKIYKKHLAELKKRQDKYDEQHRTKDKGHNWWRAALDKELAALEQYKSIEVFARVNVSD